MGAFVTSLAITLALTPIDIVAFRHKFVKSDLNTSLPQSLKQSQTLMKTMNDVMNKEGKGLLFGMTFTSTFVRYFFILTAQNIYINYDRLQSKNNLE